jgi:hypothetical protein
VKKTLFGLSAVAMISVSMAHHSGAMFDHSKVVTYQGTVKEFQYTNPHSWLQVMVTGPDGKAVEWGFEAEGPSTLKRVGIEAKTFKPGEKVTVLANPMRDGRPAGAWITVTTADGKVYSTRPAPPPGSRPPAASGS